MNARTKELENHEPWTQNQELRAKNYLIILPTFFSTRAQDEGKSGCINYGFNHYQAYNVFKTS